MPRRSLSARFLDAPSCIPATGQIDWFDPTLAGFGVRASHKGTRSFFVLYRRRGDPTKQRLTFKPPYPTLKLAAARQLARDALQAAGAGRDPKAELDAQLVTAPAPAAPETFREAVEDYVRRYQRGEKANAQADEVKRVLLRECAEWLERPVNSIAARDVRRLLEGIRDGFLDDEGEPTVKPRGYLANRAYSYLGTFYRWCAEPGIEKVDRSPMVGLRAPWDGERKRERVYSNDDLQALWKAGGDVENVGRYGGALLRVMLLLGKRKGMLAAMRHDEIADDGLWTPPQDTRRRRGNKRKHAVPLPQAARDIIAKLPKVEGNPFVFVGRKNGHHLDPGTPLQNAIKKASGVGDFFYHAVRHTVETRLAELKVPPHIRDMLLDHAPARGAGAGYDHHTYKPEMSEALEAWSRTLQRIIRKRRER